MGTVATDNPVQQVQQMQHYRQLWRMQHVQLCVAPQPVHTS